MPYIKSKQCNLHPPIILIIYRFQPPQSLIYIVLHQFFNQSKSHHKSTVFTDKMELTYIPLSDNKTKVPNPNINNYSPSKHLNYPYKIVLVRFTLRPSLPVCQFYHKPYPTK